jgi:hypothetical protein
MRSILAATALLAVMGATPSMARDYPWCERTSFNGFNPSCSFTSYRQCMATVSGQRGDCILNPRLAFGEQRRRGRTTRDWDGGWDNGWNPRW